MNNFRLVLLDYAKEQMNNPTAKKILADMIFSKQKNFERTNENYVVIDKHDMIGTHALVYETSNIFEPKLIFALRVTFESRARKHNVRLPMQDLAPHLDEKCRGLFDKFRKRHENLVDCNSWFVDPEFSFKTSGLRLSDIGYLMICLQIKRMGFDHFIGCSNEKYKAHRWVENIGSFIKDHVFTHPVVPDPHMMVMIEKFNEDYLESIYDSNKKLFDNLLEVSPVNQTYKSIAETISENYSPKISVQPAAVSADKIAS